MTLAHDPARASHVVASYRRYLLGRKKAWGTARGLIHYRILLAQYLLSKRLVA